MNGLQERARLLVKALPRAAEDLLASTVDVEQLRGIGVGLEDHARKTLGNLPEAPLALRESARCRLGLDWVLVAQEQLPFWAVKNSSSGARMKEGSLIDM
jgi:hypothetical protein